MLQDVVALVQTDEPSGTEKHGRSKVSPTRAEPAGSQTHGGKMAPSICQTVLDSKL